MSWLIIIILMELINVLPVIPIVKLALDQPLIASNVIVVNTYSLTILAQPHVLLQ